MTTTLHTPKGSPMSTAVRRASHADPTPPSYGSESDKSIDVTTAATPLTGANRYSSETPPSDPVRTLTSTRPSTMILSNQGSAQEPTPLDTPNQIASAAVTA